MEESTVAAALERGNHVVFMDITVGGEPIGRIFLELFKKLCPKASGSGGTSFALRRLNCESIAQPELE